VCLFVSVFILFFKKSNVNANDFQRQLIRPCDCGYYSRLCKIAVRLCNVTCVFRFKRTFLCGIISHIMWYHVRYYVQYMLQNNCINIWAVKDFLRYPNHIPWATETILCACEPVIFVMIKLWELQCGVTEIFAEIDAF